jgi:2-keto-3-deoxy-L-arabinonate dehydratase
MPAIDVQPPGGIWPVLYAYFDESNRLDRNAMRAQVDATINAGAPGIVILGLATEVHRMSLAEKHQVIHWASEDVAGRVPLAVTITGDTVDAQVALAGHAITCGASWLILQPPSTRAGIQNAPEYLGVGLSTGSIVELARLRKNFRWLKGEGPAITIRNTIDQLRAHGKPLPVFNGRGGQELIDNLRAGCAGLIVAPDTFDRQVVVQRTFAAGDEAHAEALYAEILPAIVFVMQSLDALTCYGKRIAAWRMGFEVLHDRGIAPTSFGLECARRFAGQLGAYA